MVVSLVILLVCILLALGFLARVDSSKAKTNQNDVILKKRLECQII